MSGKREMVMRRIMEFRTEMMTMVTMMGSVKVTVTLEVVVLEGAMTVKRVMKKMSLPHRKLNIEGVEGRIVECLRCGSSNNTWPRSWVK